MISENSYEEYYLQENQNVKFRKFKILAMLVSFLVLLLLST